MDEEISISVLLSNHGNQLVKENSARTIARSIMEEYYGPEVFKSIDGGVVEDRLSFWRVTLTNSVTRDPDDALYIPAIAVDISKSNGAVLTFFRSG